MPVCAISALQNKGAELVLGMIQDLLPSPIERKPWKGVDDQVRNSSEEEPLAAFVFKTITTPFGGLLSMIRVLSGKLTSDMQVFNPEKKCKGKIGTAPVCNW